MYLPQDSGADYSLDFSAWKKPKGGLSTGDWSSLIGIITAICGNILISFALNTQRYAHMRLAQQRGESKEKSRGEQQQQHRKDNGEPAGVDHEHAGHNEGDLEQGTKLSTDRHAKHGKNGHAREPTEADPLLPHDRHTDHGDESEDDAQQEHGKEKSYLKSPIWWLGITLMILGEAGNFLAYGFAPASIVSPLGVVALISNCLIAPLLLGEKFRWRDGLGVLIAVAGCVTVVLSASSSNPKLTPESIWHLITRWEFETYFGITLFLTIALSVASNRFGDRTILIDLGLVGLYGGYTALSTKGIASLLSNKVWRVITFPITYLLLAVLVFTAVMQIKYVNRALQRFNATMVIPTQFVLFTLSVIIGSAILYRDFEREKADDAAKFVGGCALTFLGVWCITSGRNDDAEDDEDDDDDFVEDEEPIGLTQEGHRRSGTQPSEHSRLGTAGSSTPSVVITPHIEGDEDEESHKHALQVPGIQPANAAAIHLHTAAPLALPPPNPPPLHATTSDPLLPTQTDPVGNRRPRTPLGRANTSASPTRRGDLTPRTPKRNSSVDTPVLAPLTPQPSRLLSNSSGLIPGPLTNTLSSSLSAIVADSLRRGVDNFPPSSVKRRPSTVRRAQSRRGLLASAFAPESQAPNAPPSKRHSIASGEMPFQIATSNLDATTSQEPGNNNGGTGGRMRSLSATLGDLFGGSNSRNKRASTDREEGGDVQRT